jgi:hypothetical protein
LLESCAARCDDVARDSRYLRKRRCTERQSGKERRSSVRGETRRNNCRGDKLGSFGGLYIRKNRLVDWKVGQESAMQVMTDRVNLPEIATAPPANLATPARPPEIPSSTCGTPNWMKAIDRYWAQPNPT